MNKGRIVAAILLALPLGVIAKIAGAVLGLKEMIVLKAEKEIGQGDAISQLGPARAFNFTLLTSQLRLVLS